MGSVADNSPLVVIVGQTASGKSALALDLAQRVHGEIIAADSRTVYRGMDIGTAKPTIAEQQLVPHHLLDVVAPDQPFSVADFQKLAFAAIDDIAARGKLPILVGGSGLYVDAVIYNFGFRRPAEQGRRDKLQKLSTRELQVAHRELGLDLPPDSSNPRRLVRSLETRGETPTRSSLRPNTLVIGIIKDKSQLEQIINQRVDAMLEQGFAGEVKKLVAKFGGDCPALQAPGYKALRLYLTGQISLEEAKQQFVQNDLQYAKRQKTWFKRNKDIVWISNPAEAVELVTTFLNKRYIAN